MYFKDQHTNDQNKKILEWTEGPSYEFYLFGINIISLIESENHEADFFSNKILRNSETTKNLSDGKESQDEPKKRDDQDDHHSQEREEF